MEPLPLEKIQSYISISGELFPNTSNSLFLGIADDGNHFLEDGIREGTRLVFDREKPHKAGELSCFMDSRRNLHLLKRKKKGYIYLGKLVGTISSV